MQILLVTEFFANLDKPIFSGGVEVRTFFIAKYLARKHKVKVLSRRRKGEKDGEVEGNLEVFRLGRPVEDSMATVSSLGRRLLFNFQSFLKGLTLPADMVEGSNYVTFLPAFWLGICKRIPKIAWYPDILIGQWRRYFGFILSIFGEIGERVFLHLPWDHYLAISENTAQKLIKQGIAKNKLTVIGCGLESKWPKRRFSKFALPTLCVISRLLPYKRVEDVIKALSLLIEIFPKIRLLIIGEGTQEKWLRQLVIRLHLQNRVKFLKRLSEEKLIEILGKSHLLIHPSLLEGFGIVLVEAAAAGTPFVAANIPTSAMLAQKLKSGLIVEPENIKSLAKTISRLLTDHKLYKQRQINGFKNAKQFTWDRLAAETEKAYRGVLK